jgi:protein gp37
MGDGTAIQWADATWNPLRGCSRVSAGCVHCYAETDAARFSGPGQPYEGLARFVTTPAGGREARWTGEIRLIEEHLDDPLRWKRPRRIFVNSMSDLFHEKVPDEWLDEIFARMALAPQHKYLVLTKRAARMRAYLSDRRSVIRIYNLICDLVTAEEMPFVLIAPGVDEKFAPPGRRIFLDTWPLPNVCLGVSTEDQATADERVPRLLDTPAAVRFVSAEPLLGPIILTDLDVGGGLRWNALGHPKGGANGCLDWVIVGGESGHHARPFNIRWARDILDQCIAAKTPIIAEGTSGLSKTPAFFLKQLGSRPYWDKVNGLGRFADHVTFTEEVHPELGRVDWIHLKHKKGGDMAEWPEDLRVREFAA